MREPRAAIQKKKKRKHMKKKKKKKKELSDETSNTIQGKCDKTVMKS